MKIVILFFFFMGSMRSQWILQNSGTVENVNCVYFVNYNLGFAACNGGLLLKTVNGGNNWNRLSTFSSDIRKVRFFDHLSGIVITAGGFYRTTNTGLNWYLVYLVPGAQDYSMTENSTIFATFSNGTVSRSTDLGVSWGLVYPVNFSSPAIHFVNQYTGYVAIESEFAGISYHSLYKTTNMGIQWNIYYPISTPAGAGETGDLFFVNNDTGYYSVKIGNIDLILRYHGSIWLQTAVGSFQNSLYFLSGRYGWSAGERGLIFRTTNGGLNWLPSPTSTISDLNSIHFANDLIGWAGGNSGVILKTTNSGILQIINESSVIPAEFSLSQNYPNPFNAVTKIQFAIPLLSLPLSGGDREGVLLRVYDIIGREVAVLVNEQLSPGTYEVDFDGSNLPSGVYYYRLEVNAPRSDKSEHPSSRERDRRQEGNFSQTRKMVLIK